MKKLLFFASILAVICIVSICYSSCASSEPSPEQVGNSFEEEIYFVSGRVSHQQLPLEGATVHVDGTDLQTTTTADGGYQLFVSQKGDYTLRFQKDGFIEMATVASFDEQAANRSSIIISPELTKVSGGVEVGPDDEIEITDPTGRAVLRLLRSVADKVNVSVTVFKDLPLVHSANNSLKAEASGVPYATVLIKPVGIELTKKSTLWVNKQTSEALTFGTMNLYERQKDNSWKKLEGVTFDKSRNAYISEIADFASYSLRVPYAIENVSEVVTTHLNGKIEIDNCGNMRAKTGIEIKVNQRCGWDYSSNLEESIRKTFAGISSEDVEAAATVIDGEIAFLMDHVRGYYDLPVVLSRANVSGNSIFNYENYAKETTQTYSFDIIYLDKPYSFPVSIKRYSGMEEKYSEISCYQHSGGQGK